MWGQRICDPGLLSIKAQGPCRGEVAEDMHRKSKWLRDIAKDNPVLGIPKSRRKERHATKGSP